MHRLLVGALLLPSAVVGRGKPAVEGHQPYRGSGRKVLIDVNFIAETSEATTKAWLLKQAGQRRLNSSAACLQLPVPDVEGGLDCLGLTKPKPSAALAYPRDAEEHFLEIEKALARWKQKDVHRPHRAAGFGGPWVENIWIQHFEDKLYGSGKKQCLRSVFGPFIPILLPWVDRWMGNGKEYPRPMLGALQGVLRKDVMYVTVAQNDVGLDGAMDLVSFPNLVVLSAGGFGHVPIPLLKQTEPLLGGAGALAKAPVAARPILASFTGSLGHSPGRMRGHMQQVTRHFVASHSRASNVTMYQGEGWREVMAASRVQLCPRGFGRTSYHVSEAVQMGLVPLHVFLDVPWVPYKDTVFRELGYSVDLKDLEALLADLAGLEGGATTEAEAAAQLEAKEAAAERYRGSHFSYGGVMDQIARFLLLPSASVPSSGGRGRQLSKHHEGKGQGGFLTTADGSDLRCTGVPGSPRAATFPEPVWAAALPGAY
jgi:hypothetical protein